MTDCQVCAAPTRDDTQLCDRDYEILEYTVAGLPAQLRDLDTTIARQARIGDRVGSRSSEAPLPVDLEAAQVARDAKGKILTYARMLGTVLDPVNYSAHCVMVLSKLHTMRDNPDIVGMRRELTQCRDDIRYAVNRRADRIYAGPCSTGDCYEDLYAEPGKNHVKCKACGAEHDVARRREWLLAAAREHLLTAPEIRHALPWLLGRALNANTMDSWIHSKRLTVRGVTLDGKPTYKVGDVIDLAAGTRERATA